VKQFGGSEREGLKMHDSTATKSLVEMKSRLESGKIIAEVSRAEIARLVAEGRIVILKGALAPSLVAEFRRAVSRWGKTSDAFPHGKSPTTEPEINYHRIDDGVIKSSLPHVFHQFGFGNHGRLGELGRSALVISQAMLDLQNEIAGTNLDFSISGCRLKVLHYPAGGGYLQQHAHPLEPQRVGLILAGAKVGEELSTGGTFFVTPFGSVDTADCHDIGDIILFRYDLPHGVSAIDADKKLDWSSDAGKWSIVLELRETHAVSRAN
jgi:hypothetical protein